MVPDAMASPTTPATKSPPGTNEQSRADDGHARRGDFDDFAQTGPPVPSHSTIRTGKRTASGQTDARTGKFFSRADDQKRKDETDRDQERMDQKPHDLGTQGLEAGGEHQAGQRYEQHDPAGVRLRGNRLGTLQRRRRQGLRRRSTDATRWRRQASPGHCCACSSSATPRRDRAAGALTVSNTVCNRSTGLLPPRRGSQTDEWASVKCCPPGGRVASAMPPILASPVGRKMTLAAAARYDHSKASARRPIFLYRFMISPCQDSGHMPAWRSARR